MSKEYFSHDYNARTDPKLVRMVMKSGLDSLAIYWCVIEMLYEQDGYIKLDYIDNIAFELHTQSDRITDVLKNYDLFKFKEDSFYSDSVLKRLELRDEISRKNSDNAKAGWKKRRSVDANGMRPHSDRNAIKVNKSKVKELNIEFSKFWNTYNKKEGSKPNCEKKWNKLSDEDRQRIIDTLPVFLSKIKDKQFQPYPETYLNQRRWDNEITEVKNNPILRDTEGWGKRIAEPDMCRRHD